MSTPEGISFGADFVKLPKGKLEVEGDIVQGTITAAKQVQQKDVKSKELKFWAPKGVGDGRPVGLSKIPAGQSHLYRPVMDIVIELDNAVSVYMSADLLKKTEQAVKDAGETMLRVGAQIGIKLIELRDTGAPSKKKFHEVKYVAPKA